MPYITQEQRTEIDEHNQAPLNAGELNYVVTQACVQYMMLRGRSYGTINEVIGVLECSKQEFYRRIAVPYENKKIEDNGDCY